MKLEAETIADPDSQKATMAQPAILFPSMANPAGEKCGPAHCVSVHVL